MTDKKDCLITIVGCGFIGQKLLNKLLQESISASQITTLVKSQSSQAICSELGVKSVALDLDETNIVLPEQLAQPNALLYYFAPPPPQGEQDYRAQHFINMLKQNPSALPAKIVLISTTGVYGNCHGSWIDENTAINPHLARAKRRADAEQTFQSYCQKHSIPLVILRVSGIYSPDKLPLKRIKAGTPIVRAEDSPYSNRIHADDLTDICYQAAFDDQIEGIFNCSDGHPTTMHDYFTRVAKAKNLPEPPAITLEQAQTQLSAGMLSYMEESRRIDNQKLLETFQIKLHYPDLSAGLKDL